MDNRSELTTKQWTLYGFLKDSFQDGVFISKKKISEVLGYAWNDKSDRNGRDIENDVRAINDSEVISKLIISSDKGYKIATQKEADAWLDADYDNVIKALKRHNKKRRKIRKDGQCRIVFGNERDHIESFIKN